MTKLLPNAAFAAGLAAIAWIAAGLWPAHPLALAMTALIAAAYLAGAAELHRFRAATAALQRALAEVPQPLPQLDDWLARVPAALRGAVRRRIEGTRVALPGPAMAPYLSGLLVLLGMLGTFLGMVVTLNGTGLALQTAADLATMRDALAAPVRGLGLAFGTSVAGVAGSAMLGLMTALARRERLAAAQALDAAADTTLRAFGPAQRRDDALALQRQQAELVPLLAERLGTLVDTLARQAEKTQATLAEQGLRLHEALVAQGAKTQATLAEQGEQARTSLAAQGESAYASLAQQGQRWQAELQAGQAAFHERAEAAYRALAESVGHTLQTSLRDAAQAAAGTVQPVVEATMAGLARETGALHARLGDALQQRVDVLAGRVEGATQAVATAWSGALAAEAAQREAAAARLDTTLSEFARTLDERSRALLEGVDTRQAALAEGLDGRQAALLERLAQQHAAWVDGIDRRQGALVDGVAGQQAALFDRLAERQSALVDGLGSRHAALVDELASRQAALAERLGAHEAAQHAALAEAARRLTDEGAALQVQAAERGGRQLADAAGRLDASVARLAEGWQQALAQHAQLGAQLAAGSRDALAAAGSVFEQQSAALLQATREAQAAAAAEAATRDAERLATWSARLDAAADAARAAAQQAADESQARQQALLDALQRTAGTLGAQAEAQATRTVAEVARVLDAAAEAPRAAADVIVQLRDQVVAGAARDRELLDERSRMLETLNTLLDAVREASTTQHAAIESLVASSAEVLAQAGQRFGEQVDAQAGRLADAAAHAAAGAVEFASLGDAFGAAVQRFGETGEQLGAQLQRVESALGQSLARSDEQLAYYVAQAREVIDLSVLAQQRVVEELQRLAAGRRAEAAEAAA